ncbi:MAG: hypothetical protein UZ12_BCD005001169 [Bacteroidetes bacterium OLB12]|nr:MAG: hypothetical protein UZ12_BCD005001169 [Bacteroidetes bacterium OLB12]
MLLPYFLLGRESAAQDPIAEIDFENQSIERLKGTVLNDSLFLTIEGLRTVTGLKRSFYWVKTNGNVRTLPLNLNKDYSIYAIGYTADEEYYYYPVEIGKRVFLRAMILNKKTSEFREGTQEVEVPGTIYGSYVKDGRVYLILAEKKSYALQLLCIKGLEVDSKKEYKLTFDLGSYKTEQAKFTNANETFNPARAFSPIKLILDKDVLWITVDEPKNLAYPHSEPPPGAMYRTTVIKIDLSDADKSVVRSFVEKRSGYFSTRIFEDKLFRIYSDFEYNATTLEVFDIATSQKVFSSTFTNKSDFPETDNVIRHMDNKIEKGVITKPFFRSGSAIGYIMSDSLGKYTLVMGGEYEYKPRTPLVGVFGLGALLASAFLQAVVYEIGSEKFTYQYVYLNLDLNNTVTTAQNVILPMKKIDEFEIKNFGVKTPPELKGYLAGNTGMFALYNLRKTNTLKVYFTE